MTAKKAQKTSRPTIDRLALITALYAEGRQEYLDGKLSFQLLESREFENQAQYLIYLAGYEDIEYHQSFVPELDNPEFLSWSYGQKLDKN
ncbi:hypothetical protein KBT16_09410 [Nostoc sp. CCCryo 231-06]|nr:hypothetical protein [Nostoc sp. CCCryo 231-06]